MPNWVTNKVKFKGRGKEILDKVLTFDENGLEHFDFNKIIPMPKSLKLTSGSITNDAIQYAISCKSEEEKQKTIDLLKASKQDTLYEDYYTKVFHTSIDKDRLEDLNNNFERQIKENKDLFKELNINTLEDLGNQYIDNILKYGNDSWYDWCNRNWGTKWNSSNTYILNDNEVEFDTAWSCPIGVLKELSKQFSDVEIYVEYADEDIGSNCGWFTLINGNFDKLVDMDGNCEFAMRVKGYTEEDIKEYFEEQE